MARDMMLHWGDMLVEVTPDGQLLIQKPVSSCAVNLDIAEANALSVYLLMAIDDTEGVLRWQGE